MLFLLLLTRKWDDFLQAFNIPADEEFVIVTTNRKEISDDKAYGTILLKKLN